VIGIIGRNGAGKSTLLKVLTRITEPTRGRITIRGRIASLLEVGTGFHPELTGRENVFLNGAILGMGKAEIRAKFDEIVAFAEVEEFLDTPVKRYSSGMYVRLAFAVAAHLEPEILVVDEVLAVGDAQFQKKCLGKMGEVATKDGRTVLFVSHNMGAVQTLCSRAIVLSRGAVICDSTVGEAITAYTSVGSGEIGAEFVTTPEATYPAQVLRALLTNEHGEPVSEIEMGSHAILVVDYVVNRDLRGLVLALLLTKDGTPLLYSYDCDLAEDLRVFRAMGSYRTRVRLPTAMLKEGVYSVALLMGYGQDNITDPNASITFTVVNTTRDLTHRSYKAERLGFLFHELAWDVIPLGLATQDSHVF
jgi:lipopolysaccharide transport system ATP-binding protein